MHQEGVERIVSLALAERRRWEELHTSRELLREYPRIDQLPDHRTKLEAMLAWDTRLRQHLERYALSTDSA
jgi:hypothetical protein